MAVLIEVYSVVIRNAVLEAKYPGGRAGYERDCPNATYCADEHLSRVGFMVALDAHNFVQELVIKGLTPYKEDACEDVAVVSQIEGPLKRRGWLRLGQYRGAVLGWLAGTEMGNLHAPPGWNFEQRVQSDSHEAAERRLQFLRSENYIDIYLDKETGQELYIGRTTPRRPAKKWWQFWV
jgi:hypothetical protein